MTPMAPGDEGGEAPCFAHLLPDATVVSDSVLAGFVRAMADAVVIADKNGSITYWNDAATRLLGWSRDEAIGRPLDLIIPERFRERHRHGYAATMTTGRTSYADRLLEVPALHRDGRILSIAFTVTLLAGEGDETPFAIGAVIRDDTERRQRLRDLQQAGADPQASPRRQDGP